MFHSSVCFYTVQNWIIDLLQLSFMRPWDLIGENVSENISWFIILSWIPRKESDYSLILVRSWLSSFCIKYLFPFVCLIDTSKSICTKLGFASLMKHYSLSISILFVNTHSIHSVFSDRNFEIVLNTSLPSPYPTPCQSVTCHVSSNLQCQSLSICTATALGSIASSCTWVTNILLVSLVFSFIH